MQCVSGIEPRSIFWVYVPVKRKGVSISYVFWVKKVVLENLIFFLQTHFDILQNLFFSLNAVFS